MKRIRTLLYAVLLTAPFGFPQVPALVPVISRPVLHSQDLPGELAPYLSVPLHARVSGFVERIHVDRGSAVHQGDLIAELSAPETVAHIAEAQAKVQAIESDRLQAEALLAGQQATLDRLKTAAQTPGAIAGNEITQLEKQTDATRALIGSHREAAKAAEAAVRALKEIESYLKITAPFDGVVTERLVHPGALVGPGGEPVLVVLQQLSVLRLTAAVPEEDYASIAPGAKIAFTVPAYPDRTFQASVARFSRTVDAKTRTMPVELDVRNTDAALAPGMYTTVKWPVRRPRPSLFVPRTSVVTTTERTFVIRDQNGKAQWVDVRKGAAEGDLVEVLGDLKPGDMLVRRASDELRDGATLAAK